MTSEPLKVLILPVVLTAAASFTVLAARHGRPAAALWTMVAGWLVASVGLTIVARETQAWPLTGYLQNFAVFAGLSAVPFLAASGVSVWLQARGTGAVTQLGLTLALGLLAILPAGLCGPYWAISLRSTFGWEYITFP